MVKVSGMYAGGRGFESHVGISPDFFCRGICRAGADLCCLSLIVTLWALGWNTVPSFQLIYPLQ